MNSSTTLIIPVYRGLTVAGNVLERDEFGGVYHILVSDSTDGARQVHYDVVPVRKKQVPRA